MKQRATEPKRFPGQGVGLLFESATRRIRNAARWYFFCIGVQWGACIRSGTCAFAENGGCGGGYVRAVTAMHQISMIASFAMLIGAFIRHGLMCCKSGVSALMSG